MVVTVSLSPTYSGCPATEVIEQSVVDALHERGIEDVRIKRVLSPPWTTDWITNEGREKLREYGIAPPEHGAGKHVLLLRGNRAVACPRCGSTTTECGERIWLDRVQGIVQMQRLPRTF